MKVDEVVCLKTKAQQMVRVKVHRHIIKEVTNQYQNMIWYDMISLFNFEIKTVAHTVIKYN